MATPAAYGLALAAAQDFRAMRKAFHGSPRAQPDANDKGSVTGRAPPHRIIQITEQPTPATFAAGALVTAGTGKGKFRKMKSDGTMLGLVEDEEITFLCYSEEVSGLAVGATQVVFRAQDLQGDERAEPGWFIAPWLDDAGAGVTNYAFQCGGGQVIEDATGHHLDILVAKWDAQAYDPVETVGMGPAVYDAIKIVQRGRHYIYADFTMESGSVPHAGTILMTDGVDFLTQVLSSKGTVGVTHETDIVINGVPGIMGRQWNMTAIAHDHTTLNVRMGGVFWLETDVELKAFGQVPTAISAPDYITMTFQMGGFFLGDFDTEWEPDADPDDTE